MDQIDSMVLLLAMLFCSSYGKLVDDSTKQANNDEATVTF
jgi:hypothetical protein